MSSLADMKARAGFNGYDIHDNRLVSGKLSSFKQALRRSYQAEWITYADKVWRCLINPVKLSPDYDQKEISIEFESKVKPGEVFYWNRTDSHWMILNQRLTEEAYFRGEIRQCDYEIDTDRNRYWIWMRGPVETTTEWKLKHNINYNTLNYSLLFYIVKNDDTNEFFKRHQKVKFDGHNWRVAAVDRYTQENILEVYLDEINDNEMEDAQIIPEIEPVNRKGPYIDGPQVVNPFDFGITYTINKVTGGIWKAPAAFKKVKIMQSDETSCTIDIITGYSGEFTLQYIVGEMVAAELVVRIDSL